MKKCISVLTALALICSAGCSEKPKSSETVDVPDEIIDIVQTAYKEKRISLEENIKTAVSMEMYDGKCYFFYESNTGQIRLAVLNEKMKFESDTALMDSVGISFSACMKSDGGFFVLAPKTDYPVELNSVGLNENYNDFVENAEVSYVLSEYDTSGNLVSENVINGFDEYYSLDGNMFSEMCRYGDDKLITSLGDTVITLRTDGTLLDAVQKDMQMFNLGYDRDGNIIISNSSNYGKMDGHSLTMPDELNKDYDAENGWYDSPAVSGDEQFFAYFKKQTGIYGITPKGAEILVVDFNSSLIKSMDFQKFVCCDEGKFIAAGCDSNEILIYERRPDDYENEKQIVEVWQILSGGDNGQAADFNKTSDKYEVRIHPALKTPENLVKAVLTDSAPDVIDYCDADLIRKLTNLGALADMNELMDEYGGISRDDIMPNVLEAFNVKGKLVALPEFFSVSMLIADGNVVGKDLKNWDFETLYDIYHSRKNNALLFADEYSDPINRFCLESLESWVDFDTKKDKFDTPEFVKFLEFAKETYDSHFPLETDDEKSLQVTKEMEVCFKDGTALFDSPLSTCYIRETLNNMGMKGLSVDDAVFLNPPDTNGKGKMLVQNCYSVLESSDCKEGAWAFVSYMLGEERQCQYAKQTELLWTNKKAFEIAFDKCIAKDGEPEIVKRGRCYKDFTYYIDVPNEFTVEQAEKFRDFVMNCTVLESRDSSINGIVWDEFDRCYNNEISAEDCAKYIHNRVEICLSEEE